MFDGVTPPEFRSGLPTLSQVKTRISRPVMVAMILALLGTALTVTLPGDASEGFHIDFIAP